MQVPPPLPSTRLHRVLAIARADGWSMLAVSGISLLTLLWQRAFGIAAAAALVALSAVAELHGRRLLLRGAASGRGWLMGAQAVVLVTVWAYAWYRWHHFDFNGLWSQLPGFYQEMITAQLAAQGLDPAADRVTLLFLVNQLVALALALVTLLYQGGLILYYQRHAIVTPTQT